MGDQQCVVACVCAVYVVLHELCSTAKRVTTLAGLITMLPAAVPVVPAAVLAAVPAA